MIQWEYITVSCNGPFPKDQLNALGAIGWEAYAVSFTPRGDGHFFLKKRIEG